jgi:histidinol phosphatase-like PHP family hydrolase
MGHVAMEKNSTCRIEFPLASELAQFGQRWDLHAHTQFVDGMHSVKEMIDAAEDKGLELFAITEHVRSGAHRWWPDYIRQMREERLHRRMRVLIGMEVNAIGRSGTVDVPEALWEDAELVLGAIHGYYDDWWVKIPEGSLSREEALTYETGKAIGLCYHPQVHVLSHPGWLFEKHYGEMPENELRILFRTAKETSTAIEVNGGYLRNPKRFLKILVDENPKVSLGSNAHSMHEIGKILEPWKDRMG